MKRLRGKDLKPRKKRADATPDDVVVKVRELRASGMLIREIAATTGLSKQTILNLTRDIDPPVAGKSWQQFSTAGGSKVRPSEITICGDGTAKVALSHGLFATIDEEDVSLVAGHRWFARRNERKVGPSYYARAQNKLIGAVFMHNLICPTLPGELPDHIDRDGLNNRKENLRRACRNGNGANKTHNGSASGYIGVTLYKPNGKWNAHVSWQGKNHSGGYFRDPVDAALARDALARRLQGEFAVLNFPEAVE